MKVRVLSYNIHGARGVDGKRDYERLGRFLKEQKIDIALIQEFDTRPTDIETASGIDLMKTDHFQFWSQAPTIVTANGWYGNAIFSRFPIRKENTVDISEPGREPRNILEAFIDTPYGSLHVMNTHKGLNATERGLQMGKLNELLKKKSEIPLIVGGDLNYWNSYSPALRKLNQMLHPISPGPTFPTRCPVLSLDRLWCRPSDLFDRASVLKTKESRIYSDHYPLLAEIAFNYLHPKKSGA